MKGKINKISPSFFPLLWQKCYFITFFIYTIYTPRFPFTFNVSVLLVCPHFPFKLHEAGMGENYPYFT